MLQQLLHAHVYSNRAGERPEASAADDSDGTEPAYTCFHGGRGITVDYMWVSPSVEVVGVWEMLRAEALETPHTRLSGGGLYAGLPSLHWGSDHMALASVLVIR